MSALPAGVSTLYVAAIVIALAVIAAAALWRRRAQPWNRWDLELYNAAKRDDIDNVVRALKHGADPNVRGPDGYTPLHIAAHENYPELAKVLIKYGAKVDLKDRYGNTPLHVAAYTGSADVAKVLLESGANPNATNNGGHTPLHAAAYEGRLNVASLLLEHGADPCITNNDGDIPLVTARKRHAEEVYVLLEKVSRKCVNAIR
jgi:cytohesin